VSVVIKGEVMRCFVLVLGVMLAGCGGVSVQEISEPEQFSGQVTQRGQPVSGVVLRFQPIAKGGTEAIVQVKDGKYTATATPGLYTYFFEEGVSPAAYQAIPDAYRHGSLEREIEVTGDELDLEVE
jgi:hypothetical protein